MGLKRSTSSTSLSSRINRSISKNMTYLKGADAIGKLYVTVNEAVFDGSVEPSARPVVIAYFERQEIESAPARDAAAPRWKDSFLLCALLLPCAAAPLTLP